MHSNCDLMKGQHCSVLYLVPVASDLTHGHHLPAGFLMPNGADAGVVCFFSIQSDLLLSDIRLCYCGSWCRPLLRGLLLDRSTMLSGEGLFSCLMYLCLDTFMHPKEMKPLNPCRESAGFFPAFFQDQVTNSRLSYFMANMQLVLAAHFNQVLVSIHAKWKTLK